MRKFFIVYGFDRGEFLSGPCLFVVRLRDFFHYRTCKSRLPGLGHLLFARQRYLLLLFLSGFLCLPGSFLAFYLPL